MKKKFHFCDRDQEIAHLYVNFFCYTVLKIEEYCAIMNSGDRKTNHETKIL
jgi:hypothetical protein